MPGEVNIHDAWRAAREVSPYLHMDAGAAARTSRATRRAMAAHADAESGRGAYVAEVEAGERIWSLRTDIGHLLGVGAGDIALMESGSAALAQLLAAWPVAAGDSVACAPSEWGPNRAAFVDRGLRLVSLPVDDDGMVDLEALPSLLETARPALVSLTVAASHRALVQPARAVADTCREYGVPVLCDMAQAVGQVAVHDVGADAMFGSGRKWLAGPRGVGFLAVHPDTAIQLRPAWPALREADWPGEAQPVRRLESREANVAGRAGLAQAVREYLDLGPERVRANLTELGRRTREALADLPGWTVLDRLDAPGAVTTLQPPAGLSPAQARTRLQTDHLIVTTAAGVERAPEEMTRPVLRLTPHLDTSEADLERLRDALIKVGR